MPNLLLCLTPRGSLTQWRELGTLSRELRPYVEYARRGWNVRVVSFRTESAGELALPEGISVTRFPHARLLAWLPVLRWDLGRWADVIKTNQSTGSWHYGRAARLWRTPMLLRCGYVAGKNLECRHGRNRATLAWQKAEARAFREADRCAVTTAELAEWVHERYGCGAERVTVLPNFVDTSVFRPRETTPAEPASVVSVGRLEPVKRFELLIEACAQAGVRRLTIVGHGAERERLLSLAAQRGLSLDLPGQLPNAALPELLVRHEVYAQVSSWEGHPKTLLEAMACGLACLVARAPGLSNQVEHERTGWVVEPRSQAVADALRALLSSPRLREDLGQAAHRHVAGSLSFEVVFAKELALVSSLVAPGRAAPAGLPVEGATVRT
jgi:glycosyltransferase involved in cell wall biosynthesis